MTAEFVSSIILWGLIGWLLGDRMRLRRDLNATRRRLEDTIDDHEAEQRLHRSQIRDLARGLARAIDQLRTEREDHR